MTWLVERSLEPVLRSVLHQDCLLLEFLERPVLPVQRELPVRSEQPVPQDLQELRELRVQLALPGQLAQVAQLAQLAQLAPRERQARQERQALMLSLRRLLESHNLPSVGVLIYQLLKTDGLLSGRKFTLEDRQRVVQLVGTITLLQQQALLEFD